MKYVWINPVVKNQYSDISLKNALIKNGFTEIFPEKNYIEIVKDKYKKELNKNNKIICDMRCPKAVTLLKSKNGNLHYPDIEPILIHIAREFSDRDDLKDGEIFIVTPCESLKDYGDSLNLKNLNFETWISYKEKISFKDKSIKLNKSPIPLGFFDDLGVKISKCSGDTLFDFSHESKIIETLYCENGCHNGDGVIND